MKKARSLVKWRGWILSSGTTENFVARKYFTKSDNEFCSYMLKPYISLIAPGFKRFFLQKIEEPASGRFLRWGSLKESSSDLSIFQALGQGKAETTLAEVYAFLAIQPNGEKGRLHVEEGNIFFVRDQSGVIRTVDLVQIDGRWIVDADILKSSHVWNPRSRVFIPGPLP